MLQTIDEAKIIITKFRDNLFIKDIMEEAKKNENITQQETKKTAA
jgi:hypothetical protein